jgi:hypothetical protein
MITSYALLLPFISAGLNRDWRGENKDGAPKLGWFIFMVIIAYCVTLDGAFAALWAVFLVGYGVPPTHAGFSARHGRPPGRRDKWWQWMQDLALWLNRALPPIYVRDFWIRFGIIYWAVRATVLWPAILMLIAYTHSWLPLAGLSMHFIGYAFRRYLIADAERVTGFLLMIIMFASAWSLS